MWVHTRASNHSFVGEDLSFVTFTESPLLCSQKSLDNVSDTMKSEELRQFWIPPTGHAVGLKTSHALLVINKTPFLEFFRHLLVGNIHSLLHKFWCCGPEGILIEAIVHVPRDVSQSSVR